MAPTRQKKALHFSSWFCVILFCSDFDGTKTTREEEDQKQRATSTRKKRDKAPRVLFHCYSLFSSVTERLFDQKCSRTKRRRHHHHHRALSHRTSKKAWRRYAAFWRKNLPVAARETAQIDDHHQHGDNTTGEFRGLGYSRGKVRGETRMRRGVIRGCPDGCLSHQLRKRHRRSDSASKYPRV